MSEKYAFSGWVWILAAGIVVGFVALGSYLIQTQQRLKAVEIELGGAKEETGRARAGAVERATVVENLRLELKAANTALNEYQGKLDKVNAAIAELSNKLDTAQADLGKRLSQLQDMEAELKDAKQAADQAKAEAAEGEVTIQDLYAAMVTDAARNDLIICDVIEAVQSGRAPLLLTGRTDHLERFSARLSSATSNVFILRGGMGRKQRRTVLESLAAVPEGEPRIILATGSYAGEGFDDARLDTLFLAMPVSWKGTLQQYVGRLHRLHHNKKEVRVYDYVDAQVPMLTRMFKKRLAGYEALGYSMETGANEASASSPDVIDPPFGESSGGMPRSTPHPGEAEKATGDQQGECAAVRALAGKRPRFRRDR